MVMDIRLHTVNILILIYLQYAFLPLGMTKFYTLDL